MILGAYAVPHPPIILPEIGRGEERKIESTIAAFRRLAREIAELKPDTIILSSPHAPLYADGFFIAGGDRAEGDFGSFGQGGLGESVALDAVFSQAFLQDLLENGIAASVTGLGRKGLDHGVLIPLRFIHEEYRDFQLVVTGISLLPESVHHEAGRSLARVAGALGRRAVYIASGDLSHVLKLDGPYGYRPEGPQFDAEIVRIFRTGELESLFHFDPRLLERAAECGLRSFQILAGVLEGSKVKTDLYSYEGPFGVGYAVASFYPE